MVSQLLDQVRSGVYAIGMEQVNVLEAKTQLSRLLARVEQGEEIVIARDGKPVAILTPAVKRLPRVPGRLKGKITIGDDFDDPLPEEFWLGEP